LQTRTGYNSNVKPKTYRAGIRLAGQRAASEGSAMPYVNGLSGFDVFDD
jgi:hypothetical protein